MVAAMSRYRNTFCTGELVDHHRVLVNDTLGFDDRVMQRRIGGAGGLHAELMQIFVVVLHHEGQVLHQNRCLSALSLSYSARSSLFIDFGNMTPMESASAP